MEKKKRLDCWSRAPGNSTATVQRVVAQVAAINVKWDPDPLLNGDHCSNVNVFLWYCSGSRPLIFRPDYENNTKIRI